jgi:hypothetical protein
MISPRVKRPAWRRNQIRECALVDDDRRSDPIALPPVVKESPRYMDLAESPTCRSCGKAMTFATRISMPRQIVYRCEPCGEQAWVLELKDRPQKSK